MFAGESKPKPFQRKRPNLSKLPQGKLPLLHDMRQQALQLHKGYNNNYFYYYCILKNHFSKHIKKWILSLMIIQEATNPVCLVSVGG